jgi:hypothetical protein
MGDHECVRSVGLSEQEAELRAAFVQLPEYDAADWATQDLAVVIAHVVRAGWANRSAEDHRHRAIAMLTIRLLRTIRAGMTVHAAGWEVEGRALDRLVLETRARLIQVTDDATGEMGRLWLERKLQSSSTIASALRETGRVTGDMMREFFALLSQDAHADAGGVMRSLVSDGDDPAGEVKWGPHHTITARRSLLMFASFASEAATYLAFDAGVERPNRKAVDCRIEAARQALAEAEPADRDGP